MKFKSVFYISLLVTLFVSPVFCAQYNGLLSYPGAISLTSPTTGVVSDSVLAGGFFSKNDKLMEFDSTILKSQISVLKTELNLQQKVYAEAKREFQRSQELYDGTMLSDHELKMAEIAQLKEKKLLDTLNSNLIKRSWQLKYASLKAPFDGFLVSSNTFPGQYIANQLRASPILEFVSAENIMIEILLSNAQLSSESKLMKLEQGDEVKIQSLFSKETEPNSYFKGEFITLINALSQDNNSAQGNKILILKLLQADSSNKQQKILLNKSYIKVSID